VAPEVSKEHSAFIFKGGGRVRTGLANMQPLKKLSADLSHLNSFSKKVKVKVK
jgi:hypothetical protein